MSDVQIQSLKSLAIAGAILFAAYKWAPNNLIRSAVVGVAGVAVANKIPYLNSALA